LDLIDILLEEGADPTLRDSDHHSAYQIAEFHNQTSVMERFADDTPASRFDF
jgi:ankyrin repeat protein